jgi:thiamine pyrophosphate-dependent acetolactate synthase large subunit-like protein
MTGAGVLLTILNGYGVDHIFCSPGSEWDIYAATPRVI